MKKLTPTEIQKKIIQKAGNLVVTASAGTGKTFTLVQKIDYEAQEYKGFKTIAAITFTIKAAKEIKDRLNNIDTSEFFIGTNNSFAIDEVIRPFIRDVYGDEFDVKIEPDYNQKFNTIEEGLNYIKKGILGSYSDNKTNFVFELALYIVKKSRACSLYLKSKYRKLYIDEYQDSDKDMHEFFMYLVDFLGIEAFIVGDEKQSIYLWRNANPEYFKLIKEKSNFSYEPLLENHRSCKQIQNYSNLLFEETRHLYSKLSNLDNIILIDSYNWEKHIKSLIDLKKKLAVLRYKKEYAKNDANSLSLEGIDTMFIPLIPVNTITSEYSWLCQEVCKFCKIEHYSVYDVINANPLDFYNFNIGKLKSDLTELKGLLKSEENFKKLLTNIFSFYFSYILKEEDIDQIWTSVSDDIYTAAFEPEKYRNVAMTFHSSKGLEFDQVIIFSEDYPLNDESSFYNHYVAVTRAKEKLIIVHNKRTNKSISYLEKIKAKFSPYPLQDILINEMDL
jgi:superfamily I DNA/RNA helicase